MQISQKDSNEWYKQNIHEIAKFEAEYDVKDGYCVYTFTRKDKSIIAIHEVKIDKIPQFPI